MRTGAGATSCRRRRAVSQHRCHSMHDRRHEVLSRCRRCIRACGSRRSLRRRARPDLPRPRRCGKATIHPRSLRKSARSVENQVSVNRRWVHASPGRSMVDHGKWKGSRRHGGEKSPPRDAQVYRLRSDRFAEIRICHASMRRRHPAWSATPGQLRHRRVAGVGAALVSGPSGCHLRPSRKSRRTPYPSP